jgi:hypothetical protein
MSAFVIDNDTMHRVIRGLFGRAGGHQIVPVFNGAHTMPGERLALDPTATGRELFTMNVEAVTQRYLDFREDPSNLPGPAGAHLLPETYQAPDCLAHQLDRRSMIASYKATRSLIYQCSEGNVPESPLYSELTRAAGELAAEIVRRLPEYDAAPW